MGDLLGILKAADLADQEHAHVRFWFRGHAAEGWKLQPGVYRPSFNVADEGERRLKENHLAQDFRILSAGIRIGRESHAELYFLQQHYRMPTRLLDWSNSALAALFFAVDENKDFTAADGELFMMDAYQLSHAQGARYEDGRKFEGIATSMNKAFEKAVSVIRDWNFEAEFPEFIIPVRPEFHDKRMSLQRSCFTFHVPTHPELTKELNPTLAAFPIPKDAKREIRRELTLLGIDAFAVYGGMDRLADTLKGAYRVG